MTEQSPQNPAAAPPKPWYMKWWVWLIAAVVVIGGIDVLVNPEGIEAPVDEPDTAQTDPTETEESAAPTAGEVIYEANEAINGFVLAFNETHPDVALAAEDLTAYHHHGRDHDDQVKTQINGAEVVISEDSFSHGSYGISVVWDNPAPVTADANLAMFQMLMEVVAPDLSEADMEVRWQQILAGPKVKWDDGTEVTPGPTNVKFEPGTFSYVKLYG